MQWKLDRYIALSFVEPFLVATGAIVGLYLVGDAFNDLDEYLREAGRFFEALSRMAQVYALRVPTFLAPVLPVSMLLGAAYGVAQLSGHNEITAMKACGVSFWRLMAPIYGMSVLLAVFAFANQESLVPEVERRVTADRLVWIGKAEQFKQVLDYLESEQTFYTIEYNLALRKARNVTVLQRFPDGSYLYVTAAEVAPTAGGWLLRQAKLR